MEPKDKDNKPIIPTLKDSTNKPQLKIKGLAQGGMSLVERLKQFKKKDLAFIMAGLGVLFMAPLAEHFMMAPEGGDAPFGQGISSRGDGKGAFGGSSSPYETGGSSLAPGSALGANGDVITPLNVRDPSALVMGPGSQQQAPAGSPSTVTPPPDKKESGDWKDALANAGASAAKAATKKASLPVPKVPLGASGLRGLGALGGGGGGASFSAGPISAANVPNRSGGGSNMAGIKGAGNVKGVARGPGQGAGGGFDALKRNAAGAASDFNRSGASGAASLESAASRNMGGGDAFGGASGESNGKEDKGPGGNQGKDSKSVGESLDFLRRKAEQDHAIDLEWKLKEKAAMRIPNLEDKIMDAIVMDAFVKPITTAVGKAVGDPFKGSGGSMSCVDPADPKHPFPLDKSEIAEDCAGKTGSSSEATKNSAYGWSSPAHTTVFRCPSTPIDCSDTKGGDTPGPKKKEDALDKEPKVPGGGGGGATIDVKGSCSSAVTDIANGKTTVGGGGKTNVTAGDQSAYGSIYKGAQTSAVVENAFSGADGNMSTCGGTSLLGGGKSITSSLADSRKQLQDLLAKMKDYNAKNNDATGKIKETETTATKAVLDALTDNVTAATVDLALPKLDPATKMLTDSPVSAELKQAGEVRDAYFGLFQPLEDSLKRTNGLLETTNTKLSDAKTSYKTAGTTNDADAASGRKDDVKALVGQGNTDVESLQKQWDTAHREYTDQRSALDKSKATAEWSEAGTKIFLMSTGEVQTAGSAQAGALAGSGYQSQIALKMTGDTPEGVTFLPLGSDAKKDSYVDNITLTLTTLKTQLASPGADSKKLGDDAKKSIQADSDKATNFIASKVTPNQATASSDLQQVEALVKP